MCLNNHLFFFTICTLVSSFWGLFKSMSFLPALGQYWKSIFCFPFPFLHSISSLSLFPSTLFLVFSLPFTCYLLSGICLSFPGLFQYGTSISSFPFLPFIPLVPLPCSLPPAASPSILILILSPSPLCPSVHPRIHQPSSHPQLRFLRFLSAFHVFPPSSVNLPLACLRVSFVSLVLWGVFSFSFCFGLVMFCLWICLVKKIKKRFTGVCLWGLWLCVWSLDLVRSFFYYIELPV